ncbi:MAG: hypothetical protein U0575_04455 [Phycisphaerales bacterium]
MGTGGGWGSHRRLSIIDLSPEGHQPMVSASGRYRIAYNGEVYNFDRLRFPISRIAGVRFRGHSDTEVMLAAFEHLGVEEATRLHRDVRDRALGRRRTLTLVRDRIGKKPLYWGLVGADASWGADGGAAVSATSSARPALVFASELRAARRRARLRRRRQSLRGRRVPAAPLRPRTDVHPSRAEAPSGVDGDDRARGAADPARHAPIVAEQRH